MGGWFGRARAGLVIDCELGAPGKDDAAMIGPVPDADHRFVFTEDSRGSTDDCGASGESARDLVVNQGDRPVIHKHGRGAGARNFADQVRVVTGRGIYHRADVQIVLTGNRGHGCS